MNPTCARAFPFIGMLLLLGAALFTFNPISETYVGMQIQVSGGKPI